MCLCPMDKAKQDSKTTWVHRWNSFTDADYYTRDLREKYLPTELSELPKYLMPWIQNF